MTVVDVGVVSFEEWDNLLEGVLCAIVNGEWAYRDVPLAPSEVKGVLSGVVIEIKLGYDGRSVGDGAVRGFLGLDGEDWE